jgi:hypothetical protein
MSPNKSSSAAASFNCGNDTLAKLLVEYFSKFNGKTESLTQLKPLPFKIMHHGVVFVTDEGEFHYDIVIDTIEKLFKSGGKSNLIALNQRQANGVIELLVENTHEDGTTDLIPQSFKIKDDQIVRIEAESSPAEFGVFVKHVEANSGQKIKRAQERTASFIGNQVIKIEETSPEKFKKFVDCVLKRNSGIATCAKHCTTSVSKGNEVGTCRYCQLLW